MTPRKAFAKQLANKVAKDHGYITMPADPFKFCTEVLGFEVHQLDIESEISAIVMFSEKMIGVNQNHHPNRQRFSLAHEIGHYYLHRDYFEHRDENLTHKEQKKIMESEADNFASEFLMPSELVKETFNKIKDAKLIAKMFAVSEQSFWIKLQDLKLI
jgi:Zn-dependent peptidase ImmA (M78 family)